MNNYFLVNGIDVDDKLIECLWKEFYDNNEYCSALRNHSKNNVNDWKKIMLLDSNTTVYFGIENHKIVCVIRISPKYPQKWHGNIGYAVVPSERGNKKAYRYIPLAEEILKKMGIEKPIMCIKLDNVISQHIVEKVGYKFTGNTYEMIGYDNLKRTFKEYKKA